MEGTYKHLFFHFIYYLLYYGKWHGKFIQTMGKIFRIFIEQKINFNMNFMTQRDSCLV